MTNTSDDVPPTKPERTIFQKDNTQKGLIEEIRFAINDIGTDIIKYERILLILIKSGDPRGIEHVITIRNTVESLKSLKMIFEDNLKKVGGR